ncbi:MAG: ATP synthase subunit I [Candidatus Cloacimonadia bacterium]
MGIKSKELRYFLAHIYKLIFLTDLLSLVLLPINYKLSLGYILGSLASSVNFYFQAISTEKRASIPAASARLSVFKNFYLRYVLLGVMIYVFIRFLPVNIITLIPGLISVQIVILFDTLILNKRVKLHNLIDRKKLSRVTAPHEKQN